MPNNRSIWLIVLSTVLFFGAAFVTLRAAEQASRPAASATAAIGGALPAGRSQAAAGPQTRTRPPSGAPPAHPPASAPEESATISDDPTTAPDPSQSADNNVSFPNDI
jgi:hypothetical protein